MSEASTPQPSRPQPPEDFHWGISYLREDFQDLRQEVRGEIQQVRGEMQGLRQEMREEIRTVHNRLDARFSSLITAMIAIGGLIVSLLGVVIVMLKG